MPMKTDVVTNEVNLSLWDFYLRGLWDEWGLLTVPHSLFMSVGTSCEVLPTFLQWEAKSRNAKSSANHKRGNAHFFYTWAHENLIDLTSISFPLLSANSDQEGFCGRWSTLNLWDWTMGAYFSESGAPRLCPKECSSTRGIWGCAPPQAQCFWKIVRVFMRSYSSILGIMVLVFHSDMTWKSCPSP